jgi:hypothetical protein
MPFLGLQVVAHASSLKVAIDSRMRIKTTTYSDVQQKPCQFYWHGLLHFTIVDHDFLLSPDWGCGVSGE